MVNLQFISGFACGFFGCLLIMFGAMALLILDAKEAKDDVEKYVKGENNDGIS